MRVLLTVAMAVHCLSMAGLCHAELTVADIFGDHMVLQAGQPVPVWGMATPGAKVTVSTDGMQVTTTAATDGRWEVRLPAHASSTQGVEVTVSGDGTTVVLQDVVFGDVWLCSGQSNMAFPLRNADGGEAAISEADLPLIRLFVVPGGPSFDPRQTIVKTPANGQTPARGEWVVCQAGAPSVGAFSAVGFLFGREVNQFTGQPVGLIQSAVGGTPAQAWTSQEALAANPQLTHYVDNLQSARKAAAASKERPKEPPAAATRNSNSKAPTVLFNGMIQPLIPFAIKGAIWYQGEGNANSTEAAVEYATLFPAMIADWRQRWGQGDFPFLFVQLAGYDKKPAIMLLRESQRQTLALPHTGMAVALDIGDPTNIHPTNKLAVGQRLAQAARSIAYGQPVVKGGPLFASLTIVGNRVRLTFSDVGGGLVIGSPAHTASLPSAVPTAARLQGFEVAGADGKFFPAAADIDGATVVVHSPEVPTPVSVRYGWAGISDANLFNAEGFPASPFRAP